MYRVLVLMSVYNGCRFMEQQIDSILRQEGVAVDLLIRDDGSTDNSLAMLKGIVERNPLRIALVEGCNIGSTNSFSELLRISLTMPAYDYYAFADQDDVWLSRKLCAATNMLSVYGHSGQPIGYCCNATLVDENLNYIRQMHAKELTFTKESALLQNIATGCTMVFNGEAVRLYVEHKPEDVKMHDHQMFMVCLYMGHFVYDHTSYIQYRQHGSNQVGEQTFTSRFVRRLKHLGESDNYYLTQNTDFLRSYNSLLSAEDIKKIEVVTNYKRSLTNRLSLLFNPKYRYDTLEFNITMFLKVLLGKL